MEDRIRISCTSFDSTAPVIGLPLLYEYTRRCANVSVLKAWKFGQVPRSNRCHSLEGCTGGVEIAVCVVTAVWIIDCLSPCVPT